VIFCRYDIPFVPISDKYPTQELDYPRIDNAFFRELASYQGTCHRIASAHPPKGNDQAEATHKEIFTKLKMHCSSCPHDWDQKVFHEAYAYNATVHTVLGETPFYCLHGYHPCSACTMLLQSLAGSVPARGIASEVSRFTRDQALALQSSHGMLPLKGHVPSPGVGTSRLGGDHALTQKVHT
jgi:hypothetical protein